VLQDTVAQYIHIKDHAQLPNNGPTEQPMLWWKLESELAENGWLQQLQLSTA
jgi:hypothetical protein